MIISWVQDKNKRNASNVLNTWLWTGVEPKIFNFEREWGDLSLVEINPNDENWVFEI